MGDPDLYRGEQVLLRTPGVYVKSIPFEGILTNIRIILVDRAKNILPTKEVAYGMIQEAEIGANAIGDQILTLTVQTDTGENRQMILTFSQREGGDRTGERDQWVRIIQQGVSTARNAAVREETAAPQRVQVKRTAESGTYERPVPAPRESGESSAPGIVFCSKCGNRVLAESAFCNKCGSPIVAPARASRQAPPPVQAPAYETPAAKVAPESFRTTQPQAPRPAVPLQKPAKKGFLSGLFGGGKKKQAAKVSQPVAVPPAKRPKRSLMPGKKIIIAGVVIVAIIAVLAIGALVVYPMIASGFSSGSEASSGNSPAEQSPASSGETTPSGATTGPLTNTGVASITVKETTAPTVPVTGVWILFDYVGSYKGTYGMSSDPQNLDSSGSRLFEVVNATGTVQAVVEKKDSSTKHALTVSIYKDGKILKSGTTSASYGKVTVSADTGISATPATTTAVAAKTTVTTKATTKST